MTGYHFGMEEGVEGVGLRLRQAREAKKLSRADLSRKTGIGEKTITKAEGRASAPEAGTLLILARVLDQDPWFLTFGESVRQRISPTDEDVVTSLRGLQGQVSALFDVLQAVPGLPRSARDTIENAKKHAR